MNNLLREIQVNKTKKVVYAMNTDYEVIAQYPVGTDFYEGFNENGEPYSNVDDGVYDIVRMDIDYPYDLSAAYGWAYIQLDTRGRAIHGGGSNLGYDMANAPYQELLPTYGCFRMHNAEVFALAQAVRNAQRNGIHVDVTVVS